jgi:outer membrane biosynthesis protein TonB
MRPWRYYMNSPGRPINKNTNTTNQTKPANKQTKQPNKTNKTKPTKPTNKQMDQANTQKQTNEQTKQTDQTNKQNEEKYTSKHKQSNNSMSMTLYVGAINCTNNIDPRCVLAAMSRWRMIIIPTKTCTMAQPARSLARGGKADGQDRSYNLGTR